MDMDNSVGIDYRPFMQARWREAKGGKLDIYNSKNNFKILWDLW